MFAGLAGVASRRGQAQRAIQLFGTTWALREALGKTEATMWHWKVQAAEIEAQLAAARARLDEATATTTWAAGRAMPLEQALRYALDDGYAADTAT